MLDIYYKKLADTFIAIPFNQLLGLELEQINAEQVILRFRMKKELIGNFLQGILHGGVISSVLDMAGGMSVMAYLVYKNVECTQEEIIAMTGKTSTIDLQINYLRPGRGDVFTAKSWLIKGGKKICFTRMELINQENSLIASASGTYLVR